MKNAKYAQITFLVNRIYYEDLTYGIILRVVVFIIFVFDVPTYFFKLTGACEYVSFKF